MISGTNKEVNVEAFIQAFLDYKDGGKKVETSEGILSQKKQPSELLTPRHSNQSVRTGGVKRQSSNGRGSNSQYAEKNTRMIQAIGSALEPRDMGKFLLRSGPQPKTFPYLTPLQSFDKNMPRPKEMHKKKTEKDTLRIIPFGGLEQVGINCMGFEYNNEIIIVDMGIQFPNEHMHGVGGKIPDISYIKGKKIIAIFITHGHIDHIGAIPQLMRMIGTHVPIYASAMAAELIEGRQKDFKMPLNVRRMTTSTIITAGTHFLIEPFTVDHSIPDSYGLRIHTPVGKFIHTGDWKFDNDPREGVPTTDHDLLKKFGREGVRALLSDSTNAHMTGSSMAEKTVIEPLENIFAQAKGRIFTGTFSSLIGRLNIIIAAAQKNGRKVCFLGRGMQTYVGIAQKLGYLKMAPGVIIEKDEMDKLPDNQQCFCCTGAQGERYAALMRISVGESRDAEFRDGDTVVLSASVIPGNERKLQDLMDLLAEQQVHVHHYRQSKIHSGGHAQEEDVKQMITEIQPEVFIPIYGQRFMLHANKRIAQSMGYKDKDIFVAKNGQIMEFTKDAQKLTNIFASHRITTIDGNMVGFTGEREFLERYQMMQEGVIVINVTPSKTGPKVHIISHGCVDFSALPDLRKLIITEVIELYKHSRKINRSRDEYNKLIRRKVQYLVWKTLAKEPVVIVAS
ncbi:ribonuclease J [Candidatus Peregrinibacteria bacterium]|nr:MAG: ribonuclease J [Candidatus Peregrinibacteria bacterium]